MQKFVILFAVIFSGKLNYASFTCCKLTYQGPSWSFSLVVSANGILSQLSEILEATAVAEQGQARVDRHLQLILNLSVKYQWKKCTVRSQNHILAVRYPLKVPNCWFHRYRIWNFCWFSFLARNFIRVFATIDEPINFYISWLYMIISVVYDFYSHTLKSWPPS